MQGGGGVCFTELFLVPKGVNDIRMVYNGTSSSFNCALWYPHFSLVTISNNLWAIEEVVFVAYRYMEKMFLNFMMGE